MSKLEIACKNFFKWFSDNGMKVNPNKIQFPVESRNKCTFLSEISISQKRLEVIIAKKLNFNEHVSNIWQKGSQKIIFCQFGYCPLVWISHSREMNSRINRLHDRALRMVYDD